MANDEVREKREERLVVGDDADQGPDAGNSTTGDSTGTASDTQDSASSEFDERVEKLVARDDKLVGTVLDDKIEIVGLLGKGGMSSVYKARHLILDQGPNNAEATPDSLRNSIKRIRKELDDGTDESSSVIENIPRVGYRLRCPK